MISFVFYGNVFLDDDKMLFPLTLRKPDLNNQFTLPATPLAQ